MKNLFLWLTDREADALLALDVHPAGWRSFDRRTRLALYNKGLVTAATHAVPTQAGRAAITLTRALRHVNVPSRGILYSDIRSAVTS